MFTKVFTGVFKNPNRTRVSAFLITALLVLGSLDSQAQFTIPLCSTSLQVATFPSMISCGSDPCTFSWTGSPGLFFSCSTCDETTISSSTPGVYSATLHFNNGALNFTVTLGAVDADNDGYLNCDDCNDNNALEKPGQVWYKDSDNDGYGDAFSGPITQCARPIGYKLAFELVALNTDCDDNYNSIHPGAPEICDGLDNNCNNMTDEGVGATYYRDQDGDGYGNPAMGLQACSPPQGYVSNNSDCNDGSPLEKPGQVWYKDSDNDGYAATGAATITQCQRPGGYKAQSELTATAGDCNDNNGAIHPGASEVCDGVDNNCNNAIDEGVLGTYYRDQDEDGFGDPAVSQQSCSPPPGYVTDNTDCNDNNASEKPGQVWYLDSDGDGYGDSGVSQVSCTQPEGYAPAGGDCNDDNPDIHPNAIDDVCNGIDEDCSGTAAADDVPPTAICRPVTVQLDADGMGATSEAAVDNGSNDDCGIQSAVLSGQSFSCSDVGANTVTLTVTDIHNNVSTCPATVTVEDNVAPAALCRNVTVQLDAGGNGSTSAAAVDNGSSDACGVQSAVLSRQSFNCSDVGANTVTLTVTDVNNNISTCPATVTVEDNVAPTALCRNVTVQLDAGGNGSTLAAAVDNGSSDACGIQSAVLSRQSFSCGDVGANTVTLTVTDVNNNVSTCPATVTVEDNVAPTALCRNVTVQLDANGNGSTTAEAVDNGSGDACGVQSAVLSGQSFSCSDVGANTVTLTVTDVNNNASTCTATVSVEDHVAPTALCQNVTVQLDQGGEAATTAAAVNNGSGDACGIQSAVLSRQSFSCSDVGANTVTLTVTDANNNASTCTATVFVEDDINPVALCRNITVLLDGDGQGEITAQQVDNGSSDACGILTLELNQTKVDCNNVGSVSVTLTATDINGNEGTCSATVSVVDPVAPEALCQNVTVQLDENGDGSTAAAAVDNGSNDACGIQSAVLSGQSFSCSDVGANTVTLTVTDVNNNASTCTATVSVEDHVAPTALCRNVTVQFDENGEASTTAAAVDNGSNDACGVQSVVLSQEAFSCTDPGPVAVTLTVTDVNGNTSTCTASVTVEDHINPEVDCSAVTVSFTGEASLTLEPEGMATASDNCAVTGFEADPPSISCADLGETLPVTVTVRDPSGNTASCIAHVTVEGLPCGWTSMSDGIGCTNGNDVDYDAQNGTFTMMATGCYTPGATSDESGYINYRLCGDGSITAHIAGLTLPGFAGIVMRESEAPGAKKVAMAYQGVNAIARYVRYATNGAAYPSYINTPGSRWLRIVRTGNVFRGYHSVNGVTWTYAFAVTVPMDDCIQVGLIAWGTNANSAVTATFDHVVIDPPFGATVQRGTVIPQVTDLPDSATPGADLWPNPTTGAVTLELTGGWETQNQIEVAVFDDLGRLVKLLKTDPAVDLFINLDLTNQAPGVYLVRVSNAEGKLVTRRMVVGNR